jgi:hypothetical protein
MSHWVCGAAATSVAVAASANLAASGSSARPTPIRSGVIQDAPAMSSGGAEGGALSMMSPSKSAAMATGNAQPSTGAAAPMATAQVVLGGLAGVLAVFL